MIFQLIQYIITSVKILNTTSAIVVIIVDICPLK